MNIIVASDEMLTFVDSNKISIQPAVIGYNIICIKFVIIQPSPLDDSSNQIHSLRPSYIYKIVITNINISKMHNQVSS